MISLSFSTVQKTAAITAGVALVSAGLALLWQGRVISGLRSNNTSLQEHLALESERASVNAAAVKTLEHARQKANTAVLVRDGLAENLSAQIGVLQRQIQEAAKHETNLDAFIAHSIADALCLQYAAASGYAVRDTTADAPVGLAARADDTAAGQGHAPALDCSRWRRLTYRDLVEWQGELLRHAGLERADKAVGRAWLQEMGQ